MPLPLFTEMPRKIILGNSEGGEGIKRAEAVRPRPVNGVNKP